MTKEELIQMAKSYYPHLWNDARIDCLVKAGKLTESEAKQIKAGEK